MSVNAPNQRSQEGDEWQAMDPRDQASYDKGGHIKISAILCLIIIFLLISIHLYRYLQSNRHRHRRAVCGAASPVAAGKLKSCAAAALPVLPFLRSFPGDAGIAECAVCLCAAEEGETMRLLPDCKHVFHAECIDMWWISHTTCPVCRREAKPPEKGETFGVLLAAAPMPERVGGRGPELGAPSPKEGRSEAELGAAFDLTMSMRNRSLTAVDLERQ